MTTEATSPEHPVQQDIAGVQIFHPNGLSQDTYRVGEPGVTRIEATIKSGMHADIPYVRIWDGDVAVGEFCQHNIVGVWFSPPTPKDPGQ